MNRTVALTSVALILLSVCVWTSETWARAGGGKSAGSRGSRTSSSPQSAETPSPSRQGVPPSAVQQPMPQRSGWMSGLTGGIMGFALGGLLGGMLFGGLGSGLFGGIGLLEILLIGGLLYFAFAYMRRRQQPTPASPYGYAPPQGTETPSWQSESMAGATPSMAAMESDLERGIRHIRQMDSTFDPMHFTAAASDVFFQVQAAWMGRDMEPIRHLMTPEIYEQMHKECDRLRVERHINRLENIAVRSTDVTEVWQESGQDFVTVHLLASLLDYTVEEGSNQLVAGSRTEPVKFEEYWTFTRPVGPHPWQLGAIQQAA
ncbi:MAG TPA: Tim44 domain-containing protein [Candidatus Tectomicrobia bacterium]